VDYGTTFSADWLADIGALREAAVMLDDAGIDFVSHGGHVLTSREGRFDRPVGSYAVPFRDHLIVYTHLASITKRLRFRTGILILPMYPTVLVAKQAAELALVSGGRFELGVGISWNDVEYRAMGQDLSVRGRRLEEQLVVLKRLWSEPFVTFSGEFHDVDELGLGQLPAAPIRIWVGCGDADRLLSRVARLADGWMPIGAPPAERVARLRSLAAEAGRTDQIGVTGRVSARPHDLSTALGEARELVNAGVTAISLSPPAGSDVAAGVAAVVATRDHLRDALDS
jgi:probable F420-dependent oxidoreductase